MKIRMNKNKKVKVIKNGKVGVRFIEPAGSVPNAHPSSYDFCI
jgi:hypothetical protein